MKKFKLIILFCILVLTLAACSNIDDASDRMWENAVDNVNVAIPTRSLLAETMGLTDEQEAAILEVFEEAGIEEITRIEQAPTPEQNFLSFRLRNADTDFYGGFITVHLSDDEYRNVLTIFHNLADEDIFAYGEIVNHASVFFPISATERNTVITQAQRWILDVLELPDSAVFGRGWAFERQEENIAVQSTVNARNALGLQAELPFQIIFNSWNIPISIIIDGQELVEN